MSVNGRPLTGLNGPELMRVRASVGMVFQENALFDSLSVGDNVGYRLYEETTTPHDVVRRRVEEVLAFIGLDASYIDRAPADQAESQRATFMVLHDARLEFEGTGAELQRATQPYLQKFLAGTLPPW